MKGLTEACDGRAGRWLRGEQGVQSVHSAGGPVPGGLAEAGPLHKDEKGRYMAGDILYAEVTFVKDVEAQADASISDACAELPVEIDRSGEVIMDGHRLMPMVKYYNLPKEITDGIRQRIVFE